MRFLKILGLSVVMALAMLTALSASASATAPRWAVCAKAANSSSGDYTGKTCLAEDKVETGGKYELIDGIGKGKAFKGKGKVAVLKAETPSGTEEIECASSKSAGTPAVPGLESAITLSFKKCRTQGGAPCTSAGLKAGEIKIAGLKGTLGYVQESPPIISATLESEAHPGPSGLLVSFKCEALEASIKGSLSAVQREDVNLISKAFEWKFEGKLQTEIDNKGEALMVDTAPVTEGGTGVLIGAHEEEWPVFGDATSGEVTPVLFAAKSKGTIEELKFETGFAPEGGWCSTLEVGVVQAKLETLSPFAFETGKKTTYPYTPGPLIESHSVSCGSSTVATLSIPGFHVPIEAGVHYFLTFLPLGPSGNHFNGSRITYGYKKLESVLFVGEYSGGKKEASNAQKKNAIEEAPGLPNYEWWLEEKEAPISIWAVGTKT